ncbi:Hypothetical protein FKW44_006979 [Caligus rogercresseyi]|uniref:Uncharacterized protein n=1 Tax=Caligus rogercresseyi TaxID=217165 RepID=A0A7T8KEC3_CALRO|nr:Hypothetical protein FKW44_006979 [Caligus rogercresseyi]
MKPPPTLLLDSSITKKKSLRRVMSLPQQANEGVLLSPHPSSLISKGLQLE